MLHKNNKGSILISTLITFSIISLICMMCSSLVMSNYRISDLEYKTEQIRENNLGMIEIIKSNVVNEVKNCMEDTKTEDEFYNYLSRNKWRDFENKIKNMENTPYEEKFIQVGYNEEAYKNSNDLKKEFIHYKVVVKSKLDNYEKYSFISFKIRNPWFGIKTKAEEGTENKEDSNIGEYSSEDEKNENLQINVDDLVEFFNYKEE